MTQFFAISSQALSRHQRMVSMSTMLTMATTMMTTTMTTKWTMWPTMALPLNTLPKSGNFVPDLLTECQRHPVLDGQVGRVVGKKQSDSPEKTPSSVKIQFPISLSPSLSKHQASMSGNEPNAPKSPSVPFLSLSWVHGNIRTLPDKIY